MRAYSTKQAAKLIGVHRVTLQRWIAEGAVKPSESMKLDGGKVWLWTPADLEKARRFKATQKRGPKPRRSK